MLLLAAADDRMMTLMNHDHRRGQIHPKGGHEHGASHHD
jgi:hypothetical protein